MKKVTFSADDHLIKRARQVARSHEKTLNEAIREWLAQYTGRTHDAQEYDSLMRRLGYVRSGRRFSRDKMNER
jgi:hypothetical protein